MYQFGETRHNVTWINGSTLSMHQALPPAWTLPDPEANGVHRPAEEAAFIHRLQGQQRHFGHHLVGHQHYLQGTYLLALGDGAINGIVAHAAAVVTLPALPEGTSTTIGALGGRS